MFLLFLKLYSFSIFSIFLQKYCIESLFYFFLQILILSCNVSGSNWLNIQQSRGRTSHYGSERNHKLIYRSFSFDRGNTDKATSIKRDCKSMIRTVWEGEVLSDWFAKLSSHWIESHHTVSKKLSDWSIFTLPFTW